MEEGKLPGRQLREMLTADEVLTVLTAARDIWTEYGELADENDVLSVEQKRVLGKLRGD